MNVCYDHSFITIREPLLASASRTRLQNPHFWRGLTRLAKAAVACLPQRWLVRYGDVDTEAQLQLARRLQTIHEYQRARLSKPARSYLAERHFLQQQTGMLPEKSAFLELVMGFSENTHQLHERSQTLLSQGIDETANWEIQVMARPENIACHTPLNQRLLRANFDLCQWFVTSLLQLKPEHLDQIHKQTILGLSIATFHTVCASLEIQKQEQVQILAFGRYYLAQYLEVTEAEIRSDPATSRRANAITTLEAKTREASWEGFADLRFSIPHRQWLDEHSQTTWFFFPESFWMQYHWFNSFIGMDLITELTLVDAMAIAKEHPSENQIL
jgi:hypothetical protein